MFFYFVNYDWINLWCTIASMNINKTNSVTAGLLHKGMIKLSAFRPSSLSGLTKKCMKRTGKPLLLNLTFLCFHSRLARKQTNTMPTQTHNKCNITTNMRLPLVVALDAGTTSVRACVFDPNIENGKIRVMIGTRSLLATFQKQISFINHTANVAQNAIKEQDPLEILQAAQWCLDEAEKVVNKRECILGIANQRESVLAWSEPEGTPLSPLISWLDTRKPLKLTEEQLEYLRATTGLSLRSPIPSAHKMALLRQKIDLNCNVRLGTLDAWLMRKLTGNSSLNVTDPTNASRTGLYSLKSNMWDQKALGVFNIPGKVLPRVVDQPEAVIRGWPVKAIVGDQHAALYAHHTWATHTQNWVKCTYGTGTFLMHPLTAAAENDSFDCNGCIIRTLAWGREQEALEVPLAIGGAALNETLQRAVQSSSHSSGAVTLGDFIEERLQSPSFKELLDRKEKVRDNVTALFDQTLWSLVFSVRRAFEAIVKKASELKRKDIIDKGEWVLSVDGGLARCNPLMQLQADVCGVRVWRPPSVECTAIGVALLALSQHLRQQEINNRTEVQDHLGNEELEDKREGPMWVCPTANKSMNSSIEQSYAEWCMKHPELE